MTHMMLLISVYWYLSYKSKCIIYSLSVVLEMKPGILIAQARAQPLNSILSPLNGKSMWLILHSTSTRPRTRDILLCFLGV